jgi:hypothetical protein
MQFVRDPQAFLLAALTALLRRCLLAGELVQGLFRTQDVQACRAGLSRLLNGSAEPEKTGASTSSTSSVSGQGRAATAPGFASA